MACAEFGLYAGLRSDYRSQGLSQTNGDASALIGSEFSFADRVYAGAWVTENQLVLNFKERGSDTTEVAYYLSLQQALTDRVYVSATYTKYSYPHDERVGKYRYDELQLAVDYNEWLTLTLGGADDLFHRDAISRFVELAAQRGIAQDWVLSAGIGYHDLNDLFGAGYRYWSVGVGTRLQDVFIDFSVIGTDNRAEKIFGKNITEAGLVLGLQYSFF